MELLYQDRRIVVCVKPAGVPSTDVPGGVPALLREQLGEPNGCIRTVHRLDQRVGGVMVLARSRMAAQLLSRQMVEGRFEKEYLALVQGQPPERGQLRDLLWRDRQARRTLVVPQPGKDVKEALLDYRVLARQGAYALVAVRLHTGRTHQIRVQFASRGWPLAGDGKYGEGGQGLGLWSHRLAFDHPQTGQRCRFQAPPPQLWPWTLTGGGGT